MTGIIVCRIKYFETLKLTLLSVSYLQLVESNMHINSPIQSECDSSLKIQESKKLFCLSIVSKPFHKSQSKSSSSNSWLLNIVMPEPFMPNVFYKDFLLLTWCLCSSYLDISVFSLTYSRTSQSVQSLDILGTIIKILYMILKIVNPQITFSPSQLSALNSQNFVLKSHRKILRTFLYLSRLILQCTL